MPSFSTKHLDLRQRVLRIAVASWLPGNRLLHLFFLSAVVLFAVLQWYTAHLFRHSPVEHQLQQLRVLEQLHQPTPKAAPQVVVPEIPLDPQHVASVETFQTFPNWLQDYIVWHAIARQRLFGSDRELANHTDDDIGFLVMTCLGPPNDGDNEFFKCGGLSDRLQHVPTMLQLAARTNRMLFIHWDKRKPAPLETFLLPSPLTNHTTKVMKLAVGTLAFDWRLPEELLGVLHSNCTFVRKIRTLVREDSTYDSNNAIHQRKMICHVSSMAHHGQKLYDFWRLDGEPTFVDIYHDIWHWLFTPTWPIASRVQEAFHELTLQPHEYVTAHVRALYGTQERDATDITEMAHNAVQCAQRVLQQRQQKRDAIATTILPSKIVFASDSSVAVDAAMAYGNGTVVSVRSLPIRRQHDPLLHLDQASASHDAEAYYPIFVDLYLLGHGRCGTYNIGGFGKWSAMISGYDHHNNKDDGNANSNNTKDDAESCWIEHHKEDCTLK